MSILKTIYNFRLSFLVLFAISYLSFAAPSTFQGIPSFNNEDKLIHVLFYLTFSGALIFEFSKLKGKTTQLIFVLICALFPILIGGLIEIIQPNLPIPRTASWLDWLSDILGVAIGWSVMRLLSIKPSLSK
jgi:VanZ family protein